MNWESFISNWENIDIIKMACSLIAGVLLGIEREVKDKAAGFKTITIICLGSTLFTILSYKMGEGDSEDATRIASYVVSGIGFLGAGVIFKDGVTVSGLTTAGIIWIAAAIGMSLGFGEFIIAFAFLLCSFLVIFFGNYISKIFITKKTYKIIRFTIPKNQVSVRNEIIEKLEKLIISYECKSIEVDEENISYVYEIVFKIKDITLIEEFLIHQDKIKKLTF
ncbi:MgtC/SapB family protein [Faecalibacter rhinopitheci]|uniref:MgtC/SapB family protein n=1 Tax=Faecalibacter rhinopitheci TaxID=2779678 RepID=A0A8J7FQK2_9FLAO|nr:MgtC/SapB family protein [Faecalibacter rhinopitheci]MBF0596007.1 MgtC/SapB family protein [Faecalibacter rhinopitheci]